jgi:D-sedoheptulose 7-phosphate isomerase
MATEIVTMPRTSDSPAMALAKSYWASGSEVRDRTGEMCLGAVVRAAEAMAGSLQNGGKLLVCGNGGSAADSQHIAAEFVGVLNRTFVRPALGAIALTTDSSIITAIANDFGYARVFERQVEALGRPGDVLLGISTSGESECVVRAVETARSRNILTIGLTGATGGRLGRLADVVICVPSSCAQHTQEMHLTIEHLMTSLVEHHLFGEKL